MLVVLALAFPGLLVVLMLAMERVERQLDRRMLTDQVEWMLRSELPADAVETAVAERLVRSLAGAAVDRAR